MEEHLGIPDFLLASLGRILDRCEAYKDFNAAVGVLFSSGRDRQEGGRVLLAISAVARG
jgi:hypothetical protein